MLKQLPSRNPRSKGFKVKHFLQMCLFFAIFFWLFNQLKHSYDAKKASDLEDNSAGKTSENSQIVVQEIAKLGRKHLYPQVNDDTSLGTKMELEQEMKAEDTEDDGHERERGEDEEESEEVEDLIDVDDRDRDIVGNEEQDIEDKANQLDQYSLNKGETKSHDAASTSMLHKVQTVSTEFETASLRKIKALIESSDHGNAIAKERGDHTIDN